MEAREESGAEEEVTMENGRRETRGRIEEKRGREGLS